MSFKNYIAEGKEQKDFIDFLTVIEKDIKKAKNDIKNDNITSTVDSLVGKMARITNEDFYKHYFK